MDPIAIPEVGKTHYIPHREIIKEGRATTKMRIVYDASSHRSGQISLNEALETGPCLLPKVFDVIIRFRCYKYGITCDIKSAFLNIRIAEEDRNYLRFLWVNDILKENPLVVVKRFTSVMFGLGPSPFLLNATIDTHMRKYIDMNREFIMQFLRDLYMDDEISGTQDVKVGFEFYLFVKTLMLEGGFDLRKWNSNSLELRENISDYEKNYFQNEDEFNTEKILGISWDSRNDLLIFKLEVIASALAESSVTKRLVLKTVASIYDPLGIMSPAVVRLKALFQEVCSIKCDWDVPLSPTFVEKWKKVLLELKNIDTISLPRHYLAQYELKNAVNIELHGFCDASIIAAAAVVYIRILMPK